MARGDRFSGLEQKGDYTTGRTDLCTHPRRGAASWINLSPSRFSLDDFGERAIAEFAGKKEEKEERKKRSCILTSMRVFYATGTLRTKR